MINIIGYDVIYNEIVYKCVDMNFIWGECSPQQKAIDKPKELDVVCIDQDGEVIILHDESWRFRFVRKASDLK